MPQRILSISGLRGVVGDGLDPEYVVRFAAAMGMLAEQGTVIISRDGRASGIMLRNAVVSALTATGCRVVDAGIAATPTCGVLVRHAESSAGLQITASHNPIQWNGLKPFSEEGSVLNTTQGERLLEILNGGTIHYVAWDQLGQVEVLEDSFAPHLQKVLDLVDVESIKSRGFKVVLDCNHGSGAVGGPRFLKELGCEVHVLGAVPDGQFDHTPEPVKENLTALCDAVTHYQADVGFAQDPDADRLAIVDNTGRYIGEELTLALSADFILSRSPGPFVVNGSTSRINADIAQKYASPFYRASVGEAHVVAKMQEVGAVLGGEGNGGVIEPNVGYVRDSFVGMAYVLAGLAARGESLSEWVETLPKYTIVKDKLECPREQIEVACAALKSAYGDATPTEGDGLRLDWSDRWVQVRASNTEPILRVIAEAPDESCAKALCTKAIQFVQRAIRHPV